MATDRWSLGLWCASSGDMANFNFALLGDGQPVSAHRIKMSGNGFTEAPVGFVSGRTSRLDAW
jgi:hypothetical protein